MSALSRRELFITVWGISLLGVAFRRAGAQGLGDLTTAGGVPSCSGSRTPTPAATPEFYRPKAPERASLRGAGVSGVPLRVSGAVVGLRCGVIKDALVELWQADTDGHYDLRGFRLRGAARTDGKGQFVFETIVPGADPGHARRLNVRVTPPGKPALSTVWFFPDDPARKADPVYQPARELKAAPGDHGDEVVTLDIVFDL